MCSPLSVTYGTIELTAVIIIKQHSFLFSNCVRSWRKSSTQGHLTGRTSCPMTVQPFSSSFCGSCPPLFSPMITSRHFRRWNVSQKIRFCSSVWTVLDWSPYFHFHLWCQFPLAVDRTPDTRVFIFTCNAYFHGQLTALQILVPSFPLATPIFIG